MNEKNNKNKSKKGEQLTDDSIDFNNTSGQVKCSRQLSTIFNLLDHQKQMEKQQQMQATGADQEMTIQELQNEENKVSPQNEDKENQNDQNTQGVKSIPIEEILKDGKEHINSQYLIDQVANSGYKILKSSTSDSKPAAADQEQNYQFESLSGLPNYIKDSTTTFEKEKEINSKSEGPVEVGTTNMTGKDAFFALMTIKMMRLSTKYQRSISDLHDLFYTVSCDWNKLECVLMQQATSGGKQQHVSQQAEFSNICQWTVLEDLAVRDDKESEPFKHVLEQKGKEEVLKRRIFLEVDTN